MFWYLYERASSPSLSTILLTVSRSYNVKLIFLVSTLLPHGGLFRYQLLNLSRPSLAFHALLDLSFLAQYGCTMF